MQSMPRIAIAMWYDSAAAVYGDVAVAANSCFAAHLQLNWTLVQSSTTFLGDRHQAWQRIAFIKHLLDTDTYDVVLWLDADAAVQRKSAGKLSALVLQFVHDGKHSLLFSGDGDRPLNEGAINSGFFAIKPSNASRSFLQRMIDVTAVPSFVSAEQRAAWRASKAFVINKQRRALSHAGVARCVKHLNRFVRAVETIPPFSWYPLHPETYEALHHTYSSRCVTALVLIATLGATLVCSPGSRNACGRCLPRTTWSSFPSTRGSYRTGLCSTSLPKLIVLHRSYTLQTAHTGTTPPRGAKGCYSFCHSGAHVGANRSSS